MSRIVLILAAVVSADIAVANLEYRTPVKSSAYPGCMTVNIVNDINGKPIVTSNGDYINMCTAVDPNTREKPVYDSVRDAVMAAAEYFSGNQCEKEKGYESNIKVVERNGKYYLEEESTYVTNLPNGEIGISKNAKTSSPSVECGDDSKTCDRRGKIVADIHPHPTDGRESSDWFSAMDARNAKLRGRDKYMLGCNDKKIYKLDGTTGKVTDIDGKPIPTPEYVKGALQDGHTGYDPDQWDTPIYKCVKLEWLLQERVNLLQDQLNKVGNEAPTDWIERVNANSEECRNEAAKVIDASAIEGTPDKSRLKKMLAGTKVLDLMDKNNQLFNTAKTRYKLCSVNARGPDFSIFNECR